MYKVGILNIRIYDVLLFLVENLQGNLIALFRVILFKSIKIKIIIFLKNTFMNANKT